MQADKEQSNISDLQKKGEVIKMMRSLFSGVSGIKVHQTRMDVIGNNIANINTIGFKSSRTTFSDMLSQIQTNASAPTTTRGGVNAKQIGLGTAVESIDLLFSDASPQQTGKNTDLALAGNALFVLKQGEQSYYTRNGAFSFDELGYYVMPGSGLRVQGWNGSDGVINTNGLATDIIVPVGKTMNATETTAINYSGNLNSQSPTITKISYTEALGGTADDVITVGYTTAITVPANVPQNTTVSITSPVKGSTNYSSGDDVTLTVGTFKGDATNGYTATLTDPDGNVVGTISSVASGTPAAHTQPTATTVTATASADSTNEGITSVNVDTKNVLSAVITLSDGTIQTVTSGYYEVGKSIPITTLATVYDSEGGKHQVALLIDKDSSATDSTANTEALATASAIKVTDTTTGDTTTYSVKGATVSDDGTTITFSYDDGNHAGTTADPYPTQVVTVGNAADIASLVFDNRWRMYIVPEVGQKGPADSSFTNQYTKSAATDNPEEDGSSTTGIMNNGSLSYIYFDDRGQFVSTGQNTDPSIVFSYGDGNGSSSNTAVIDLKGLTQYANNTTSFPTSNGNTSGVLQSIAVDGNGVISGTYTNGLVQQEAQIAVAQFTNTAGLTKVGTTIYQESNNSGEANIRTVADFGVNVVSSALEMSNVDLASEFSDMIITQRGFQANSKMTTVSDEMLETLVNMKR